MLAYIPAPWIRHGYAQYTNHHLDCFDLELKDSPPTDLWRKSWSTTSFQGFSPKCSDKNTKSWDSGDASAKCCTFFLNFAFHVPLERRHVLRKALFEHPAVYAEIHRCDSILKDVAAEGYFGDQKMLAWFVDTGISMDFPQSIRWCSAWKTEKSSRIFVPHLVIIVINI